MDNMRILADLARRKLRKYNLIPLFSYDNAKIQATAELGQMGLSPQEKVPLAEYMPDGHKVIEHCFGYLKPAVQKRLYQSGKLPGGGLTATEAMQLVFDCYKAYPMAAIQKDVDSLPTTYHVISQPKDSYTLGPDGLFHIGTGGDWAPKALR